MSPGPIRLILFSAVLAASALAGGTPAASGQTTKDQKMAAASGQQTQGGSTPLRVMLVISDAVRDYGVSTFPSRYDFGRHLAAQAEEAFEQAFREVKTVPALPGNPQDLDGFDLVVVLEVPHGEVHAGILSNRWSLTEDFVARGPKGEELFRARETATGTFPHVFHGSDQLGEEVTRKFVQELLQNPNVKSLLSPPAPVEAKPALADTSMMDSGGLDVPPPPPWAQPGAPVPPADAIKTEKP